MKYRKTLPPVDAVQFDGTEAQADSLIATYGAAIWKDLDPETGEWMGRLYVSGSLGVQAMDQSDWLVIAGDGGLSVCGSSEFTASYTAV